MPVIIKATLTYTVDDQHPDIQYISHSKDRQTISDTYTIAPDAFTGEDGIREYIRNDLSLVAGGGYNADHIHDVVLHIENV